jgi:TPR repeat protein
VAGRPSPRATDLLARGQEAEQLGDVSGARRFYASAVQLGSATAARNLGRLYDPVFLKRTALGGIDPDLWQARHWYELAIAMGDPEAAPLLEALALR